MYYDIKMIYILTIKKVKQLKFLDVRIYRINRKDSGKV